MTHRFPKAPSYLPLLFVTLLLASCGGGGESNSLISGNPGSGVPPLPPSAPAPAKISRATPRPGSVTQSSNTKNGITTDKIQLVRNDSGPHNFRLIKNNKLMIEYENMLDFYGQRDYDYPYDHPAYNSPHGDPEPLKGDKENNFWNDYYYDVGYGTHTIGPDRESRKEGRENASFISKDVLTGNGRTVSYVKIDNNLSVLEVYPKKGYNLPDVPQTATPDFLMLGWWAERNPGTLSKTGIYDGELGAFVVSSGEYPGTVKNLTGTARYKGPIKLLGYSSNLDFAIEQLRSSPTAGSRLSLEEVYSFIRNMYDVGQGHGHRLGYNTGDMYGDIELNVNFGDSSSLGYIEGKIKDIESNKPDYSTFYTSGVYPIYGVDTNLVKIPGSLTLEKTAIGDLNSGFFKGNVSGNLGGRNYTGKWGGQFYPNGDTSTVEGVTVGGTMAASSGDFHIIAPWAADHENR